MRLKRELEERGGALTARSHGQRRARWSGEIPQPPRHDRQGSQFGGHAIVP